MCFLYWTENLTFTLSLFGFQTKTQPVHCLLHVFILKHNLYMVACLFEIRNIHLALYLHCCETDLNGSFIDCLHGMPVISIAKLE